MGRGDYGNDVATRESGEQSRRPSAPSVVAAGEHDDDDDDDEGDSSVASSTTTTPTQKGSATSARLQRHASRAEAT